MKKTKGLVKITATKRIGTSATRNKRLKATLWRLNGISDTMNFESTTIESSAIAKKFCTLGKLLLFIENQLVNYSNLCWICNDRTGNSDVPVDCVKALPSQRITSIDYSSVVVEQMEKKYGDVERIEWVHADCTNMIQFADCSFDGFVFVLILFVVVVC